MLSNRCLSVLSACLSWLSVLSVCNVGVMWPNSWMDQDAAWHVGRHRSWPHCVRWGHSSPSPKGHSPHFSTHVCCGKTAGWINMPLGMEVGLGPHDCVRLGPRSPQNGAQPPIFDPCLLWPNG